MTTIRYKLIGFSVLLFGSQIAFADGPPTNDGWSVSTFFGILSSPNYLGDNKNQLLSLPDVRVAYGERFFASLLGGIGYNAFHSENLRAGPIIKYNFGRSEDGDSPLRVSGDDTNDLRGLGDVDGSAEAGAYIAFDISRVRTKLEVRQGLSGGHEGLIAKAELKYAGQFQMIGKPVFYAIGPEIVYGDENYNSTFFGVDSTQSTQSGLAPYQAKAGLVSYGLHSSLVMPVSNRVTLVGFAGYNVLGDEAAESSLVTQRGSKNQAVAGLLVSYSF